MLIIEDDVINLTRGDDAAINVSITDDDGQPYTMQEGDRLILTVRETPDPASPIIFQTESNNAQIVIVHADTADKTVGRYSADIQLVTQAGRITTIYPRLEGSARYKVSNFRNFIIMPEVTIP